MQPAWSAVSTAGLRNLLVIPGVEKLILLVDNDANGVGQSAAAVCMERWTRAGRKVVRLMPKQPGTDFNDLILEKAA